MLHREGRVALGAMLAVVVALMIVRLEDAPTLFSDEGWALSVAHTWAETGHYAEMVLGQPVAPSALNIGLPAIAPMALSYRLLGVGIWQGRLPSVFWTLGCLILIYALARRFYNEKVALWSVIIATLATGLHAPMLFGKQALGEMPALCFTLAGYLVLATKPATPRFSFIVAGILWGLAAATKMQVLPFILVSSLGIIGIALARRKLDTALCYGLAIGSLAASLALTRWAQVQAQGVSGAPLSGAGFLLLTSVAFGLAQRAVSLVGILQLGVPAVVGLCYAIATAPRFWDRSIALQQTDLLRWGLILFSASWLAWYLSLAVGWGRYLVIPVYTSTIFVAAALVDVAGGERLAALLKRSAKALRRSTANSANLLALCLLLALAMMTVSTLVAFGREYLPPADHSVEDTARYLNTYTDLTAVVETYEMELLPLLEPPVHYPQPPDMQKLIRRYFQGDDVPVDYDALQADPAFLVTGPLSSLYGLYDSVIRDHEFELVWTFGRYQVYRRVK